MGEAVVKLFIWGFFSDYCVYETEFSVYTFESRTMIKYLQVWHEE